MISPHVSQYLWSYVSEHSQMWNVPSLLAAPREHSDIWRFFVPQDAPVTRVPFSALLVQRCNGTGVTLVRGERVERWPCMHTTSADPLTLQMLVHSCAAWSRAPLPRAAPTFLASDRSPDSSEPKAAGARAHVHNVHTLLIMLCPQPAPAVTMRSTGCQTRRCREQRGFGRRCPCRSR